MDGRTGGWMDGWIDGGNGCMCIWVGGELSG